jgi:hypothetical protein
MTSSTERNAWLWTRRLAKKQRVALALGLALSIGIPIAAVAGASAKGSHQATATCVNNKAINPDGCWTPPAGYVEAPRNLPFAEIPVPAYSSSTTPLGTITDQAQPPFSSSDYDVNNSWAETSGGNYVSVFAGNEGGDSSQGVVVVDTGPIGTAPGAPGYSETAYPTSGQDGSLTMVSASGWTITLEAADGTTYYFDATTDAYVSVAPAS